MSTLCGVSARTFLVFMGVLALVGLLGRFDIALDREALLAALHPVEAPHPARQPAPPAAWKRRDQRKELS